MMKIALAVVMLLLGCRMAGADSLWNHNGSVVRLIANGSERTFVYEKPRRELEVAGVGRGTILFKGVRDGKSYRGTAHRFSRNCSAPLPYAVSGRVETEKRIVLHGRREVFDSSCRPTGAVREDTLVFDYISQAQTGAATPDVLAPFAGSWTSRKGDCTTDFELPDAAQIVTIDTQFSTWKTFAPHAPDNEPYDWCDAENPRPGPSGSTVVDLRCAHPGHSREDVTLLMSGPDALVIGDMRYYRCE